MPKHEATRQHHTHPIILARAKELRRPQTHAEATLWQQLRAKQLYGLKFRRQHPIYRFIVDFYCHQHQLVIEIDGDSHTDEEQMRYDEARTAWLEAREMRVIRFTNRDVEENLQGVLDQIAIVCGGGDEAD